MVIGIDASRADVREKTGTEWYSWHLITRLPGRLPEHRIRLYLREAPEESLAHLGPNVEIHILRWAPGILWSHLRLSWELWRHAPDVLFVPADTVPLRHPPRTITTIHDVAFERFPELYRGRSVQRRIGWLRPIVHAAVRLVTGGKFGASELDYHRWSVRHAVRTCDRIITVSEFSKQEIIATVGAEPGRITVIPLGVAQPATYRTITDSDMERMRQKHGIPDSYFLFLGRLESKKNIVNLIRAYDLYRRRHDGRCAFVMVGNPGFGWDEAKRFLDGSVSARTAIIRLPWQNTATIQQLQKGARVFIFATRYEGFGLPPLESLSAGVPVIASTSGSLPEILGAAAYYVNPDDVAGIAQAMAVVDHEAIIREQLITAGFGRVRQYSWDRTAELTAAILRP